jgi:tRNA(Arg) A34 adenosine deaminase TadA
MHDWEGLSVPWREALLLMWEAYSAGTIPVGAVITDEAGEIVARGRNRIFDARLDGELGRSRLAHAELNAMTALTSERRYEGYTLYTALEPCHLCLSAAVAVRLGRLCFASSDAYGGAVGKLLASEDHRNHPLDVQGPLDGPAGRLPELLLVAHFLWRLPDKSVVRFYRETRPELVAAAARVPPPDAGATLEDAFATLATY